MVGACQITLPGVISATVEPLVLQGTISPSVTAPRYPGPYDVTPAADAQALDTDRRGRELRGGVQGRGDDGASVRRLPELHRPDLGLPAGGRGSGRQCLPGVYRPDQRLPAGAKGAFEHELYPGGIVPGLHQPGRPRPPFEQLVWRKRYLPRLHVPQAPPLGQLDGL